MLNTNTQMNPDSALDQNLQDYSFQEDYILRLAIDKAVYDEFINANLEEANIALSPLHWLKSKLPQTFEFSLKIKAQIFESLGAVYINNGAAYFTDNSDIKNFYLFIARVVGVIDPLYGALYDVKSKPMDSGGKNQRITVSQTSGFAPMHTDGSWLSNPPDAVGLLCLSPALSGGENELVHSHQIRAAVKNHSPEMLKILQKPFHRESASPGFEASSEEVAGACFPIIQDCDGFCRIQYMRRWIEEGHTKAKRPLDSQQVAALDYLDSLLSDPSLIQEVPMKKYDMILTNNHTVLHTRKPFKDSRDEAQKRHMVRVWTKK